MAKIGERIDKLVADMNELDTESGNPLGEFILTGALVEYLGDDYEGEPYPLIYIGNELTSTVALRKTAEILKRKLPH